MALHPDFPTSPYAILGPGVRWFPEVVEGWQDKHETMTLREDPTWKAAAEPQAGPLKQFPSGKNLRISTSAVFVIFHFHNL